MATDQQFQFSLLSRGPLFEHRVLDQYLRDLRNQGIPNERQRAERIHEWIESLKGSKGTKETALEQAFNHEILGYVLGYSFWPANEATAWTKPPSSVTRIAGEPDILLGRFAEGEAPRFDVVVELKGPGTSLDKPQAREKGTTPVEQAFEYGTGILGVRWVIVSDMRRLRLYSVESQHEAVEIDLATCTNNGVPTQKFRELWGLFSCDRLVGESGDAPVSQLLTKSTAKQLEIRDSFYEVYYCIRADLIAAIKSATAGFDSPPGRDEILTATQRLLDRMLFIYYCEDTPDRLIPENTVRNLTESARRMPGPSSTKVYSALKALFVEVDKGSPSTSQLRISGYNGELFKHDRLIDEIDLPDALHDRVYTVKEGSGSRSIQGVWGLHAFDFWRELNEHLLGHVFEQSLSDIVDLHDEGNVVHLERLGERQRHGVYYTSELLADSLCEGSLVAVLDERAPVSRVSTQAELRAQLEERRAAIGAVRVLDLACGSGAFLVSSYQALLGEMWSTQDAIDELQGTGRNILSQSAAIDQSALLRNAVYGVDLLPQAAEIAKLALWLRSARRDEKVPNLNKNVVAADSLDVDDVLRKLDTELGTFDLVVGNPPWGAAISDDARIAACQKLGLNADEDWDSWELFVALALAFLAPGGRLAFVLPDTLFSPDKAKIREIILRAGKIERLNDLGPDWFDDVRMGTVLLQMRRGPVPADSTFRAVLLAGALRRRAITGKVPLSQIEASTGRDIPQDRAMKSGDFELEVFRSVRDDQIIDRMIGKGIPLVELTDRGRGEEINKLGMLWICPSCFAPNTPGAKAKSDARDPTKPRYHAKDCANCGAALKEHEVSEEFLVTAGKPVSDSTLVPYIDGDDFGGRFVRFQPSKGLNVDVRGFKYKPESFYVEPKLLVRKTGVGLVVGYDDTGVRFPQTVFFYRLKPSKIAEGYKHEFVLAALLSRTMAYFLFKRYGQVDPARGHAHLTHKRLEKFPIPRVDFKNAEQKKLHDDVVGTAQKLLDGELELGGREDMDMEVALRKLWGLKPNDGAHINLELAQVPSSQTVKDLFPGGLPQRILRRSGTTDAELQTATPPKIVN